MGSGCVGRFVGHFVSSCYRMSIPCPADNAMFVNTQSAFDGDRNSSRALNGPRSSGGDVGHNPRELRNIVNRQNGVG